MTKKLKAFLEERVIDHALHKHLQSTGADHEPDGDEYNPIDAYRHKDGLSHATVHKALTDHGYKPVSSGDSTGKHYRKRNKTVAVDKDSKTGKVHDITVSRDYK